MRRQAVLQGGSIIPCHYMEGGSGIDPLVLLQDFSFSVARLPLYAHKQLANVLSN